MPRIRSKVIRVRNPVTGEWNDLPAVVSMESFLAAERAQASEAAAEAAQLAAETAQGKAEDAQDAAEDAQTAAEAAQTGAEAAQTAAETAQSGAETAQAAAEAAQTGAESAGTAAVAAIEAAQATAVAAVEEAAEDITEEVAQIETNKKDIGELKTQSIFETFIGETGWQNIGLSSSSGGESNSSTRISTINYISETNKYIYPKTGYEFSVFAWDSNEAYQGVWNGTAFVTTGITWFDNEIALQDLEADYKLKILARKSDNTTISVNESNNIIFGKNTDETLKIPNVSAETTTTEFIGIGEKTLNIEDYQSITCVVSDTNTLLRSSTKYLSRQIPVSRFWEYIKVTSNSDEAYIRANITFVKKALPRTPTQNADMTGNLATGETGRHIIEKGDPTVLKIPNDTAYIVIATLNNNNNCAPESVVVQTSAKNTLDNLKDEKANKQELNILAIGNSFTQDAFSYLPSVLNDILPEYKINYGILYRSGTEIGAYYEHATDKTWNDYNVVFNKWDHNDSAWTRYRGEYSLIDVLQMRDWNLIYGQITGNFSGETWSSTGIDDSKNFVELLKDYCSDFNFVTGAYIARQTNGDLGVHMAPMMADLCRNAISYGRFTDFIPIGMAIQNARTNSALQALGDSETHNMIYSDDTHMQNGIPTLIAAYTIAGKILQWFGFDVRGINGSTWIPTTENVISIGAITQALIDQSKPGMTHGASVGVDTAETAEVNMKIAQNVAIKAILYPDHITDWEAGTAPGNKFDIIAPIYSNRKQYKARQIAFHNNILYQCQSLTVNDYDSDTNYAVGDYTYYDSTIYKCIAATTGTFDSESWEASFVNFDSTKWLKITLADVLEQILEASN